jgi:glycosyltransferase involved in cell wall biosynthesis
VRSLVGDFAPACAVGVTTAGVAAAVPIIGMLPLWGDLYGSLMAEAQLKAQVFQDDAYLAHFWQIEMQALERADRFSTVSERQQWALIGELGLVGRLNRWTSGYAFATTIPIAAPPSTEGAAGEPPPSGRTVRGKLVPDAAFIILYSGGYNTWCDVEGMVAALDRLMSRYPQVRLVSTGGYIAGHDPLTFARMERLIRDSPHADRYHLQGWVPAADLPGYYREADVALNVDKPSYEAQLGSRTRVMDWMAAGLPCVMSALPELADEVRGAGAGLTYPAGDVEALAACLERCLREPDLLRDMRTRTQALCQRFSVEATTSELLRWAAAPTHAPDFRQGVRPLIDRAVAHPGSPVGRSGQRDQPAGPLLLLLVALVALWGHIRRAGERLGLPSAWLARVGQWGAARLGVDRPRDGVAYLRHTFPARLRPGTQQACVVTLKNVGRRAWASRGWGQAPIHLSYHWRAAGGAIVEKEGRRTPISHGSIGGGRVPPGAEITVEAQIDAPATPGAYLLELDMVREGVTWLSECGSPVLCIPVSVVEADPRSP